MPNLPSGGRLPWRPWQIVRFTVGYLSHGLGDLFFITMTIPLAALLALLPRYRYRLVRGIVSRYLVLMFQRVLTALGVYRIVEVSGLDRAQGEAPVVFVANHRGRLDGPLLLSYLQGTGVVVKSRYARRGTLAVLAWVFDFIPIEAQSLDSLATMTAAVRRLIERGTNLLIFPEGSRSVSGRLLPFRSAAFRLAVEEGRPVVPVIVHSTAPFMSKSFASFYPREPLRFRIRFLPPQWPAPAEKAEDLASRVHRLMARELRDLDSGTVWASRQGLQS
jgi:1-acyl-sn-glycerol-3-phosphate acyltransferase